jgi:hypothetical protein
LAESVVLSLGEGEIGVMMESERFPVNDAIGLVPSRGVGRADEDALEGGDHGVAIEGGLGLR